jgi:glycosyltransferase involved in cell wall biosynthesis
LSASDSAAKAIDELREGVWIVIPAFREEGTIGEVVRDLRSQYPNVLVVDDGSPDATGHMARQGGARVVRHAINRGQGAALQTGIDVALERHARWIVTFDADGQHRVADIEELLTPLFDGRAEVVLGSRFLGHASHVPFRRRVLLRAGVRFTRWTSGLRVTDTHNGLRAFSRDVAARLRIRLDRMAHASEILDQVGAMGVEWTEVPVHVRYTRYSRAKGQSGFGAFRILLHYILRRSV